MYKLLLNELAKQLEEDDVDEGIDPDDEDDDEDDETEETGEHEDEDEGVKNRDGSETIFGDDALEGDANTQECAKLATKVSSFVGVIFPAFCYLILFNH